VEREVEQLSDFNPERLGTKAPVELGRKIVSEVRESALSLARGKSSKL
jgi:hypothetical protein